MEGAVQALRKSRPGQRFAPWRRRLGFLIALAGSVILIHRGWQLIVTGDVVGQALLGGLAAALATALGAVPALFAKPLSARWTSSLLGFGAGVMLAATAFSLIVPALASARAQGHDDWTAASIVGLGILLGGVILLAMDRYLPHEHVPDPLDGPAPARGAGDQVGLIGSAKEIRRIWLFVFAICLHNFPEGLAIGVAFAGTDVGRGAALATGISIQDIPEGLVVALALRSIGISPLGALAAAAGSGLIEPVGAVLGATLIGMSSSFLPWGLALAAGAMIFVISHEVIPESHRKGHERFATTGLMLGFVTMMMLDTALA